MTKRTVVALLAAVGFVTSRAVAGDPPAPPPPPKAFTEPKPRASVVVANPEDNLELPPPAVAPLPAVPYDQAAGDCAHPPATYDTHVLDYVNPWSARGKRCCGSVYMSTPYIWFDSNVSLSWIKKGSTPPLVTSSASTAPTRGQLNAPGTTVLFDGQDLHDQPFVGGRFSAGAWFEECQLCGLEVGFLFLGAADKDFIASGNGIAGSAGLFVPFFNPRTNLEDVFVVADPGNASGIIRINSRTSVLGGDGHGLFSVSRGCNFRIDALVGVRWLNLNEEITIEENVRQTRSNVVLGNTLFIVPTDVGIYDQFATRNDFIGGELGLKTHHRFDCWTLDMIGRLALGGTHQVVRNDGWTGVTLPGFQPVIGQGGRLITTTNVGSFASDKFSIVPEFGTTLGWEPRSWVRFSVGYSWLFWNNVVRPGDQIDRVINPVGVPTRREFNGALLDPARPAVLSQQTDFWVQSVTLGVQFMY
ncbi:MAG: BBP7 family outer membrane beta-barrel protein [Gemmataceae bacterium]